MPINDQSVHDSLAQAGSPSWRPTRRPGQELVHMVRLLLEATRAPLDRLWIEPPVAEVVADPSHEDRSDAEETPDGEAPADPS